MDPLQLFEKFLAEAKEARTRLQEMEQERKLNLDEILSLKMKLADKSLTIEVLEREKNELLNWKKRIRDTVLKDSSDPSVVVSEEETSAQGDLQDISTQRWHCQWCPESFLNQKGINSLAGHKKHCKLNPKRKYYCKP